MGGEADVSVIERRSIGKLDHRVGPIGRRPPVRVAVRFPSMLGAEADLRAEDDRPVLRVQKPEREAVDPIARGEWEGGEGALDRCDPELLESVEVEGRE
jgi:hypothetical protein